MPEFLKKIFGLKEQVTYTGNKYLDYDGLSHIVGKIKNKQTVVNTRFYTDTPKSGETPMIMIGEKNTLRFIDVYLNGMKMFEGMDYTVENDMYVSYVIFAFPMTTDNNKITVETKEIEFNYN